MNVFLYFLCFFSFFRFSPTVKSNWELDLSVEHSILLLQFSLLLHECSNFLFEQFPFYLYRSQFFVVFMPWKKWHLVLHGLLGELGNISSSKTMMRESLRFFFRWSMTVEILNSCGVAYSVNTCLTNRLKILVEGFKYTFWHSFLFTGQLCSVLGEELSTQMRALIVSLLRIWYFTFWYSFSSIATGLYMNLTRLKDIVGWKTSSIRRQHELPKVNL